MNVDLTEAVDAGARARFAAHGGLLTWEQDGQDIEGRPRESVRQRESKELASLILAAAAPIIAKQVAEQIAAEIEAEKERARRGGFLVAGVVYDRLASIAREAVTR